MGSTLGLPGQKDRVPPSITPGRSDRGNPSPSTPGFLPLPGTRPLPPGLIRSSTPPGTVCIKIATYIPIIIHFLDGKWSGNWVVKFPFWDSQHRVLARKIWNSGGTVRAVAHSRWGSCERAICSPSRRFLARMDEVDSGSPRPEKRSWGLVAVSRGLVLLGTTLYNIYISFPSCPGSKTRIVFTSPAAYREKLAIARCVPYETETLLSGGAHDLALGVPTPSRICRRLDWAVE